MVQLGGWPTDLIEEAIQKKRDDGKTQKKDGIKDIIKVIKSLENRGVFKRSY